MYFQSSETVAKFAQIISPLHFSPATFPYPTLRWPGLAPAGDLLSCVAKKVSKEGDPRSPGRPLADCPALLAPGGRRRTRPAGSDSCAGRPRPGLRCSAGQIGRKAKPPE